MAGDKIMAFVKRDEEYKKKKFEDKVRLVELEILFAKGWNSRTTCSLPHWRFWKHKLHPNMTDFQAYELGSSEFFLWETTDLERE